MKRIEHSQIELQIAPMIDVCFLLLFFYILTSKPVKPEADMGMTLPGTVSQEESVEIPDEQRISIQEDGQIILNDLPMDHPQNRDLPALLKTLGVSRKPLTQTRARPSSQWMPRTARIISG